MSELTEFDVWAMTYRSGYPGAEKRKHSIINAMYDTNMHCGRALVTYKGDVIDDEKIREEYLGAKLTFKLGKLASARVEREIDCPHPGGDVFKVEFPTARYSFFWQGGCAVVIADLGDQPDQKMPYGALIIAFPEFGGEDEFDAAIDHALASIKL